MMLQPRPGLPVQSGLYVVYVNNDATTKFAKRIFLVWDEKDTRWYYPLSDQRYRGHTYGFIGPIPAMRLED